MASPKKFFFDVWLAQGKTVYRDVPYEVVTDWLTQGRLLGDDRIRPAKTEQWFLIETVPAFAGFIPRTDPLRTDEKAEALEPVETEFSWGPKDEEDADPDMIPLIDVSLVLLIFFMITSSVASVISKIPVPLASPNVTVQSDNTKLIWIGIKYISETDKPEYSMQVDGKAEKFDDRNETTDEKVILKRVDELTADRIIPEIRLAASR